MPTADPADVCSAAAYVAEVLAPQIASGDWDGTAGGLAWDCRLTLGHAIDACNWYAALLARAGDGDLEVAEMGAGRRSRCRAGLPGLGGGDARRRRCGDRAGCPGLSRVGSPDRTGYAVMGADEVLVHGWDIACRFGLEFAPPDDVRAAVLRRIFPWAPDEQVAIRPLDEWDGRTAPTWDDDLRPCPRPHRFPGSAYRWRRGAALGRHRRLLAEEPLESVGLGGRGGLPYMDEAVTAGMPTAGDVSLRRRSVRRLRPGSPQAGNAERRFCAGWGCRPAT